MAGAPAGRRTIAAPIRSNGEANRSSGAVISVGHHPVTPCARNSPSIRSHWSPDAVAQFTSSWPFTWRSRNPGHSTRDGTAAPAGAGPTDTIRPSSTTT